MLRERVRKLVRRLLVLLFILLLVFFRDRPLILVLPLPIVLLVMRLRLRVGLVKDIVELQTQNTFSQHIHRERRGEGDEERED